MSMLSIFKTLLSETIQKAPLMVEMARCSVNLLFLHPIV